MATAVSADERTPMLRARAGVGSDTHDDYWTTGRYLATAVVIPMLLIASVFGAFTVEHPSQGFRQGAGRGRTVEYTLHTSCISAETRAAMPAFFRPGASVTGASIVRHDPSRPGLGLEEGVTMRSAPQPTTHSEPGRFVATAEVDGDWGFALRNSFGETFYEMGSGEDAPMWGKSCPDARTFRQRLGKVIRTLAPRLKKPLGLEEEEAERHASFVFGSCDTRCDEAQWAGEELFPKKKRPSARERARATETETPSPKSEGGERKESLAAATKSADPGGPGGSDPAAKTPVAKASGSAATSAAKSHPEPSKTSAPSAIASISPAAPKTTGAKEPSVETATREETITTPKEHDAEPTAREKTSHERGSARKGEGKADRR